MTIAEIKKLLSSGDVSTDLLIKLENDSRQGVQRLVKSYKMQKAKKEKAFLEFKTRFSYEKEFWCQNKLVAGVDEVGRGPLAGPVVTAAVILDKNFDLIDVNDSKKLTPKKRNELFPMILDKAVCVSVGLANNDLIDKINIYEADRVAMARAVKGLKVKPDALLVDAMDVPVDLPQLKLIRGDSKSNSIAAASIVAKVFVIV